MRSAYIGYFLGLSIFWILSETAVAQDNPNADACRTLDGIVSACERLTPGFTAFTNFNFQAPCLCYASTYWFPNGYDGWIQSCYLGFKTYNPAAYSSATATNGGEFIMTPCHKVGNILSSSEYTGPVTELVTSLLGPKVTSSPKPSSITNPYEMACVSLNGANSYCLSLTPDLSTVTDFRYRASCFCYSGLVWNPSYFDKVWASCVQFISTASPSYYSAAASGGALVLTSTPCAAVGDVRDIRNSRTSTTSTQTAQTGSSQQSIPSATSARSTTQITSTQAASPTTTAIPSGNKASAVVSFTSPRGCKSDIID